MHRTGAPSHPLVKPHAIRGGRDHDEAVDHGVDLGVQPGNVQAGEPLAGGLPRGRSQEFAGRLGIEILQIDQASLREQATGDHAGAPGQFLIDLRFFIGEVFGQGGPPRRRMGDGPGTSARKPGVSERIAADAWTSPGSRSAPIVPEPVTPRLQREWEGATHPFIADRRTPRTGACGAGKG